MAACLKSMAAASTNSHYILLLLLTLIHDTNQSERLCHCAAATAAAAGAAGAAGAAAACTDDKSSSLWPSDCETPLLRAVSFDSLAATPLLVPFPLLVGQPLPRAPELREVVRVPPLGCSGARLLAGRYYHVYSC
jgi:hypothetical protein